MLYQGILGLHSLLRWAIIILLIVNISRSLLHNNNPYNEKDRSWNLRLVIITHITLLVGLYQYFFGPKGFALVKAFGMKAVMKDAQLRFWVIEHLTGMVIAIVLITISSSISKKVFESDAKKHRKLFWLYSIALFIVLASVPWPFRFSEIPWFRGLN